MIRYFLYLTGTLILPFLFIHCASNEEIAQPRIPPTKSQVPRYETDEGLKEKIARLESKMATDPENASLRLQLASLYLDIKDEDQALIHLEYLDSVDYTEDPRLYGSLASIYKKRENYDKAIETFIKFKSLLPANASAIPKIDKEIESITFIKSTLAQAFTINLRRLSDDINTDNSEYLPQFTIDNETIIFTRRFFNQEDLFIAKKTSSGYEVSPIEEINTLKNEGAHSISADGNLLIFTHCDKKYGYGSCDLYRSQLTKEGKWSTPANMGAKINSRYWDSQPSLSADGRTLFFVSKRDGGYGGSDIWSATKSDDGYWNEPSNLGPAINTRANDESPFIHPDGKTLYFRSRGHQGMGDYDLFKATLKDGKWTDIQNLGSPINSTGNDGALVVSLDGTRGYYATDLFENEKLNNLDLVEFDLPLSLRPAPMTFVKGRVLDGLSKIPIQADIEITYLDDSNYKTTYATNFNGEFLAAVPIGQPVMLHITSNGYLFFSDHISYEEVRYSVDPYILNIGLYKKEKQASADEKSEPVVLRNIFFASGSASLLPMSQGEITTLYELLRNDQAIRIQISGHTDDVGTAADNLALSKNRAEAVRQALIDRGIAPDRLVAIGYGEEQPIDTNETEEGRSNNRRTEFLIIY